MQPLIQFDKILSNNDYAVAMDVTLNYYFQVFKDFFYADIDVKPRIKIIREFARYHPDHLFWLLPTNKGWHCFLISHRLHFQSEESQKLLSRLCSDNLFRYNCKSKGYSLRLNRKLEDEPIFGLNDVKVIGNGIALPELIKLFKTHVNLLKKYYKYPLIACGRRNAQDMLDCTLE